MFVHLQLRASISTRRVVRQADVAASQGVDIAALVGVVKEHVEIARLSRGADQTRWRRRLQPAVSRRTLSPDIRT
jgi:hypothetical protein